MTRRTWFYFVLGLTAVIGLCFLVQRIFRDEGLPPAPDLFPTVTFAIPEENGFPLYRRAGQELTPALRDEFIDEDVFSEERSPLKRELAENREALELVFRALERPHFEIPPRLDIGSLDLDVFLLSEAARGIYYFCASETRIVEGVKRISGEEAEASESERFASRNSSSTGFGGSCAPLSSGAQGDRRFVLKRSSGDIRQTSWPQIATGNATGESLLRLVLLLLDE